MKTHILNPLRFLVFILLLGLAACQNRDFRSVNDAPPVLGVWLDWENSPSRLQSMFDRFAVEHEALVEVSVLTPYDKITTALKSDDPPAILVYSYPYEIGKLAADGLITPLDDLIAQNGIDLAAIYPAPLKQCQYAGKYYCLPWGTDTYTLYWNKDLFRAAGLNPHHPPETMEEMVAYAKQLTRLDEDGNLLQLGFIPHLPWSEMDLYSFMFGGYWYNEDATQVTINSPPVVDALNWERQFFTDLDTEKLADFIATFGPYGSADQEFLAGKVAMMVDGEWFLGADYMQRYAPEMNFGVAPFPYPADHPERKNTNMVGGSVLVIPSGVKNQVLAGELLAWMVRPDNLTEFACQSFSLPTSIQAAEDACFHQDPQFGVFMDLMAHPNANVVLFTSISDELYTELETIENQVLFEGGDPQPLLDAAQERLQPLLEEAIRGTRLP